MINAPLCGNVAYRDRTRWKPAGRHAGRSAELPSPMTGH